MADTLNEREQAFVLAYVANGGNTRAAAEEAGYKGSPQNLAQQGRRLVKKQKILEAIHAAAKDEDEEVRSDSESNGIANREERKRFWTTVMRGHAQPVTFRNGRTKMVIPTFKERIAASKALGESEGDFVKHVKKEEVKDPVSTYELPNNGRE